MGALCQSVSLFPTAIGSVRPITIFTCVVLLSCIPFTFFGLCLKKFHPRKPSSYQVTVHSFLGLYPMGHLHRSVFLYHHSPQIYSRLERISGANLVRHERRRKNKGNFYCASGKSADTTLDLLGCFLSL